MPWYYMKAGTFEDTQEGPLESQEMIDLAKEGKLKLDTKVASSEYTKGRWCELEAIPTLAGAIVTGELQRAEEKEAAAQQRAKEKESAAQQRAKDKEVGAKRRAEQRERAREAAERANEAERRAQLAVEADELENQKALSRQLAREIVVTRPAFANYFVPGYISAIWTCALVISFVVLVGYFLFLILTVIIAGAWDGVWLSFCVWFFVFASTALTLLLLRISLEFISVVFDIKSTLDKQAVLLRELVDNSFREVLP